jgi:hypothetical protein
MQADKIFFFHNAKAGGTSVRLMIEAIAGARQAAPLIENDMVQHEARHGDYQAFKGFDFYCGHYGRDVFEAVREGHVAITNFRHPLRRLQSLYNYFRYLVNLDQPLLESDEFFAVKFAKEHEFDQFVLENDPRIRVYTCDCHFRQLVNSCWSLECRGDVACACDTIDAMPWYYVCEYPELSFDWAREVFELKVTAMPLENRTLGAAGEAIVAAPVDPELRQRIVERNGRDVAIYNHAVARFLDRVAPHP